MTKDDKGVVSNDVANVVSSKATKHPTVEQVRHPGVEEVVSGQGAATSGKETTMTLRINQDLIQPPSPTRHDLESITSNESGGDRRNNPNQASPSIDVEAVTPDSGEQSQRLEGTLIEAHPVELDDDNETFDVDEEQLVVGIENEERIRAQILNEEAIEPTNVKKMVDDGETNQKKKEQDRKLEKKRQIFGLIIAIIVLVLVVVAIVLGAGGSSNYSKVGDNNVDGTLSGNAGSSALPRREYLLNLLLPLYNDDDNVLDDNIDTNNETNSMFTSGTPQHRAIEWMTTVDEYYYDPVNDRYQYDVDDGHDEASFDRMLIERYVVVVFYYSTNQDPDGWYDIAGFLNSTSSICNWMQDPSIYAPQLVINAEADGNSSTNSTNAANVVAIDDYALDEFTQGLVCDQASEQVRVIYFRTFSDVVFIVLVVHILIPSLTFALLYSSKAFNGLRGTLPFELSWLSNLQLLDLASNHITGTIPHQIGKLSRLVRFQVVDNEMTGTIPYFLFGEVPLDGDDDDDRRSLNMSNLKDVTLGDNFFTGSIPAVNMYDQLERLRK